MGVFKAPNTRGGDGVHMRGNNGEEFFTNMLINAAKLAIPRRMGQRRQAAPRLDGEHDTRMIRGPKPASGMEGQQQRMQAVTWAEVAAHNHSSVLNSNQSSGLESQQKRAQPATWTEVASNNQSSVFQSNQSN